MSVDIQKYWKYVERFDLPEAKKRELIHTVWGIMESFVDRAFGLHPVQLSRKALPPSDTKALPGGVDSKGKPLSTKFKSKAGTAGKRKA